MKNYIKSNNELAFHNLMYSASVSNSYANDNLKKSNFRLSEKSYKLTKKYIKKDRNFVNICVWN